MRVKGLAVRFFCARAGKHRLWFVEWPLDGWVGPAPVGSFAWQFSALARAP